MKKLLALMILLTARTAYSAKTSKEDTSDKVALTTKLSSDAETTKDEQPSFLVRHADTMKKISDEASFTAVVSLILHKIVFKDAHQDIKDEFLCALLKSSLITILFLNPITKYSIDKKHDFKLKNLQKKLNFDLQRKTLPEQQSFLIHHADTFKRISYASDFLTVPSLILAIIHTKFDSQNKLISYQKQSNLVICIHTILNLIFIEKMILYPIVKYLMNKKNTLELEALQAQIDAVQQEETAAA